MSEFKFETEQREYKYGPGEAFETKEKALEEIKKLENKIKTWASIKGFWKSIDSFNIIELDDVIKIEIKKKVPIFLEN